MHTLDFSNQFVFYYQTLTAYFQHKSFIYFFSFFAIEAIDVVIKSLQITLEFGPI